MKKGDKKILFVSGAIILLFISLKFDFAIVSFVNGIRTPLLDAFMLWVTYAGSTISVLFILTSLLLWHEHKRRWILPLLLSLLASLLVAGAIKVLIGRTRPFLLGGLSVFPTLVSVSPHTSFPSSHAAVAFSALPILDREFPYFRFVWAGFALLVAFSRVYFALHYASDVIAGALLGYLIGIVAMKAEERYKISKSLLKRIR